MEDIRLPISIEFKLGEMPEFDSVTEQVRRIQKDINAAIQKVRDSGLTRRSKVYVQTDSAQKNVQALLDTIGNLTTEMSKLQKMDMSDDAIVSRAQSKVIDSISAKEENIVRLKQEELGITRELGSAQAAYNKNVERITKLESKQKLSAKENAELTDRRLKLEGYEDPTTGNDVAGQRDIVQLYRERLSNHKALILSEQQELEKLHGIAEQLETEEGKQKAIEDAIRTKAINEENYKNKIHESADEAERIAKAAAEANGVKRDEASNQDKITESVKKTAGAMKETSKNTGRSTAQMYYLLRVLKMTEFEVNNGLKAVIKWDKTFVSAIGRATKMLLKLGVGFRKLRKDTESTSKSHKGFIGSMQFGFKTLLKYTFGIRSLYFLVNKLRKALGDSMGVLAQSSNLVNEQMSSLLSNVTWMKNMLATVAQPILNVLVPALDYLAQVFDRVTYAIASFFATLTGQSFVFRATKSMEDYAASLDKAGKSAKKAKDNIQSFDELHVINDKNSGSGSAGAGNMFNESEVLPAASSLAEKVKSIFSTIFDPISDAWKSKGQFVMDSWKYALDEIRVLIGTIGRDFLTVWANDTGVAIWTNILHIVGDVGLIVGNLASNFTTAWNTLDVGRHILENMQSILAIIVQGIRDCSDATVVWSQNLNFLPILQAIYNLTEALQPAVQAIVDLCVYFWENVVLPFRKYMIESGLPDLLDLLSQIMQSIDWDLLEERMQKLMDAFEPFLEKTWQAFLIVLDDLGTKLSDLVNSDGFGYLIDKITKFMEEATPEEMAKSIEKIAKSLVTVTVALGVFKGVLSVTKEVAIFALLMKNLGIDLAIVKTGLSFLAGPLKLIATPLAGISAIVIGLTGFVQNFFDMWTNGVDGVKIAISIITAAIVGLGATILGIVTFPAGLIAGAVIGLIAAIVAYVHEHFDEIAEGVKNLGEKIKESWNAVCKAVGKAFKTVINSMISAFESFINFFIRGINWIIDSLNSIHIDLPDAVAKATGFESFGFNIPTLSELKLPRLAQGAVIPPNKEFMAVLGDQTSGTNIEAPLTTIQDAVALVLQPYLERLIAITEDIYEKDTSVNIGDEEIARANTRGQRKLGRPIRTS